MLSFIYYAISSIVHDYAVLIHKNNRLSQWIHKKEMVHRFSPQKYRFIKKVVMIKRVFLKE